jgi:hypothetical protein
VKGVHPAAVAVALPGCFLALLSAVALTLAPFGRYPMWPHESVNLAEAAGVREEAEVIRLIEQGQDPNERYPVRPGLVLERAARLTPLEAAVLNDDPVTVEQLFAKGAAPGPSSWVALRCFAEGRRAAPALDRHRPGAMAVNCAGVEPPWD